MSTYKNSENYIGSNYILNKQKIESSRHFVMIGLIYAKRQYKTPVETDTQVYYLAKLI